MADYQRMYTIMCAAVDDVIEPLEQLGLAAAQVRRLRDALLQAEEVYIQTTATTQRKNGIIWLQQDEKES